MATVSGNGRKLIGQAVTRPRQQVQETIKAAILSGELKSGEMLPPEAELARQFSVSRTTLREALRVLSSQHLISKVPGAHGGNFVQSVDYRSLGSVMIESVDNLLALGSLRFDEVVDVRQALEDGVASAEDIDTAMTGIQTPDGPAAHHRHRGSGRQVGDRCAPGSRSRVPVRPAGHPARQAGRRAPGA
ncbi:hypothetical protein FHT40_006746 [Mycolicibacterium sp. BK556]|nr:hypothetical protein [Mycolicibacterium sp. BK556]MBB3636844.1 hypothetical protein [Mycolicibacterium sp. BK607]